MEKHIRVCNICNKRFANGKAMGGHMRSHLVKLPIPPTPRRQNLHSYNSATESARCSPSSSSMINIIMNSHIKSRDYFRQAIPPAADIDRESETESSPRNPTRRRSKRCRKTVTLMSEAFPADPEVVPVSSISDACSEEDAAMSLLKLSSDKWPQRKSTLKEEVEEEEEKEWSLINKIINSNTTTNKRGKFKCETCKKVFGSYQALGGHKSSHKKTKNQTHNYYDLENDQSEEEEEQEEGGSRSRRLGIHHHHQKRIFECPFCFKVFESGQALGGHKKVHFSTNYNSNANNSANAIGIASGSNVIRKYSNYSANRSNIGEVLIDLNLPAPPEQEQQGKEEEEEESQIEFSTLSSDE